MLTSCAGYASFMRSLELHGVNSCIEGNLVVGSLLTGGFGSLHIWTGTGKNNAIECAYELQGQRRIGTVYMHKGD